MTVTQVKERPISFSGDLPGIPVGNDERRGRMNIAAPNFADADGRVYLVRCPECRRENYIPAVAIGRCAWCGYDANKDQHETEAES